jgi:putative membrane protein
MIFNGLKVLTLAAWSLFLLWLIAFGRSDLGRLLHPRLWWLVVCGAMIFLIFLVRQTIGFARRPTIYENGWQWPSLLILLLPLLYFSQIPTARFNNDTFKTRNLSTANDSFQKEAPVENPAPGTNPAIPTDQSREVGLMKLYTEQEKFLGKEVSVVCQTFVDDRLPENTAMCYRYMITCCAADARPLFIFLQHPKTLAIKSDKWIKTQGKMTIINNNELTVPALVVEEVDYVAEPAFPFIY